MKKYFRNVKPPRWYVLIVAAIVFTWQCTAIIPMFLDFGGGYYTVIPIQVIAGVLLVMMYLLMQKDIREKAFPVYIIISLLCAIVTMRIVFTNPFSAIAGYQGVLYGIAVCLAFATGYYFLLGLLRSVVSVRKKII